MAKIILQAIIPPPDKPPLEIECDGCYGCFKGKYYGGEVDAKTIKLHGGEPYNKCKGTGKHKVRYWTEAEIDICFIPVDIRPEGILYYLKGTDYKSPTPSYLAKQILKAYHSRQELPEGTIVEELPEGKDETRNEV